MRHKDLALKRTYLALGALLLPCCGLLVYALGTASLALPG